MTQTATLSLNPTTGTKARSGLDYARIGERLSYIGKKGIKLSAATVLSWIGAMKFTAYEAGAIEGLVASSPLTSWLYSVTSVQGASNLIGAIEITIALLLVAGLKFPKAALLGALGAIATFFVTASFMFTAPVWEASLGGFPALSVVPGQFLLKDLVLLAAAVFAAGEALKDSTAR